MPDVLAPVVLTNAVTTSVMGIGVVIFGVQTGLEYPILIAGVLGGATALSYLEPSSIAKRCFEVVTASLLAGYFSPFLAGIGHWWLVKIGMELNSKGTITGLASSIAFAIGYMAHGILLPGMRTAAKKLLRRC